MPVRHCVECGAPVTATTCVRCGTELPADRAEPAAELSPTAAGAVVVPVEDDDDPALRTSEQPWHPFEQPSWLDASADPRTVAPGGFLGSGADGADFMGVSRWEGPDGAVVDQRRRPWLLSALAAVAVVCVLGAVAFVVLRDRGTAGPDQAIAEVPPAVVTVTGSTDAPTSAGSAEPAASTEPAIMSDAAPTSAATGEPTPGSTAASASAADPSGTTTDATPAADPLGGPARDIACAPGYVVQVASAVDETSFAARVAELRAANQLPADVAVARTATSCGIFAGQSNSIVLYAGPFADPYAGCPARLAAAPDSFIKGTTPETATEYVSCLCPAQVVTVPTITTVGQTGVWVGELQRVLGNKFNLPILDLAGNWGTFTASTAEAVRQFQSRSGLAPTGTVDAGTWQALQTAEC